MMGFSLQIFGGFHQHGVWWGWSSLIMLWRGFNRGLYMITRGAVSVVWMIWNFSNLVTNMIWWWLQVAFNCYGTNFVGEAHLFPHSDLIGLIRTLINVFFEINDKLKGEPEICMRFFLMQTRIRGLSHQQLTRHVDNCCGAPSKSCFLYSGILLWWTSTRPLISVKFNTGLVHLQ